MGLRVAEDDLSDETDDVDDGEDECDAFIGEMGCKDGMEWWIGKLEKLIGLWE
jgi:hypothetical protein